MLPVSVKPRACLFLLAAVATARADETSLRGLREAIESLPAPLPAEQSHGRIGFYGLKTEAAGIVIDLGREVAPDEIVLFPARLPTGTATGDGSNGFPPALTVSISDEAHPEKAVRLARWSEEETGSGNRLPFLRLAGNGASGRYLTVAIEAFARLIRGDYGTRGSLNAAIGASRPELRASSEASARYQVSSSAPSSWWYSQKFCVFQI